MASYPTGPDPCVPPACIPRVQTMGDPGPIAVFCFWGFVVIALTSYQLVKYLRLRRSPVHGMTLAQNELVSHSKDPHAEPSKGGDAPPAAPVEKGDEVHLEVCSCRLLVPAMSSSRVPSIPLCCALLLP